MTLRLAIIILNYRTARLAIECLRSLAGEVAANPQTRVIVVDNASGDGSAELITQAIAEEDWRGWAEVLSLNHNGGYAAGNNAGIRLSVEQYCGGHHVWLLNPDTIVRTGTIGTIMGFLERHPEVGVLGCGLEDGEGKRQASSHRFPSPLGELDSGARLGRLSRWLHRYKYSPPMPEEAHACDWVSGASILIRHEVLRDAGMLDEGYFLYYDEVDFCARARAAGWEVWCVPEAKIVHLEGQSTGIRNGRRRRAKYWYDSRRRFFVKKYGIGALFLADVLWAIGRLSFLLRSCIGLANTSNDDPKWFMFDLLWGDFRAMLAGELWRIPRIGNGAQ